ncbi:hypothetical protein CHARACLAT_029444 [Characodon lateralis]|uniref:Uncharacterized protein n=1 Tax=Characodon lateralis TaxID=208331 RepID=A0ABU7F7P2_9TELE|nr:hypothetical protein [Characodon lateralis]
MLFLFLLPKLEDVLASRTPIHEEIQESHSSYKHVLRCPTVRARLNIGDRSVQQLSPPLHQPGLWNVFFPLSMDVPGEDVVLKAADITLKSPLDFSASMLHHRRGNYCWNNLI